MRVFTILPLPPWWARIAITLVGFAALVVAATWSNIWLVRTDSVLTDAVLDPHNPWVRATAHASQQDVQWGEPFGFLLSVATPTPAAIARVRAFVTAVAGTYPDTTVVAAVHTPDPASGGRPFLTPEMSSSTDAIEAALRKVAQRPYGALLAYRHNGMWYLPVIVIPHEQRNEVDDYRRATLLLTGKPLTTLEWYLGRLLALFRGGEVRAPQAASLGDGVTAAPVGWALWRSAITRETYATLLGVVGLGLVLPALLAWIFLRSWRQTLLVFLLNGVALWVVRGLIGVGDRIVEWSFHEEAYTTLALIPTALLGYSFGLRACKEYNSTQAPFQRDGIQARWQRWQAALQQPALRDAMALVALTATLDFGLLLALPQVEGVRSLLEVGTLAAFASILVFALMRTVLPTLHTLIGGEGRNEANQHLPLIPSLVRLFARSPLVGALLLALFLGGGALVWGMGWVRTESTPGAYLTALPEGAAVLDLEKGPLGSGLYPLVIGWRDITSTSTTNRLETLAGALRNANPVRQVLAPTDFVREALAQELACPSCATIAAALSRARERYEALGAILPDTFEADLLQEAWDRLVASSSIARLLVATREGRASLGDGSVVLYLTGAAYTTADMRSVRDRATQEAHATAPDDASFPGAVVGRIAIYPEVDTLITNGTFLNLGGSLALVWGIAFFYFWWRGRHSRVRVIPLATLTSLVFAGAVGATLMVMAVSHIPLDVATAAIVNITVAAAADLPIFLFARFVTLAPTFPSPAPPQLTTHPTLLLEAERAVADVGLNTLTYLPLLIPGVALFPPLREFGWLLVVSLAVCLTLTLTSIAWLPKLLRSIPPTSQQDARGAI